MQPGFERLISVVIVAGLVVFGTGATLLFLTLRAFATAKHGDIKHIVLLVATIAFGLFSAVGLLIWSMILPR